MKKLEEFEGRIIEVRFPNKCIVDVSGEKVVVKNHIEGQLVKGIVTKKRSGKYQGRVLEVLEKSAHEIAPKCPVFGECGGCLYLNLPYEEQLKMKEKQVLHLLRDVLDENTVYEGIIGSPDVEAYRNKMEYSFGDPFLNGPLTLGMHKRGSNYDIVDASQCRIVDPDFNAIVAYSIDFFTKKGVSYYHKKSHEGFLRHLVLRRGVHSGELMVNLVTTSQIEVDLGAWLEGLLLASKDFNNTLVSVLHTSNDSVADAVIPEKVDLLFGRDHLRESLLGLDFQISPFSFFQTNSRGAEKLYEVVREYVGDTKDQVVFDLYSGTGTITQLVSPVAKKAVGVEIVAEAVDAAYANAELNGLKNCEFIAGDVLKVLDELQDKPDMIILDPPREGIHPKALPKIIAYGVEKLVYVSCKPTSLAEDLKVFLENGYQVEKVKMVDMFPGTVHVEAIILMTRSGSGDKK